MPSKNISDVKISSIIKRFPQQRFAAGVHREQIKLCEEKLGIKLEDFVQLTLDAMKGVATKIGL